MASEFELIAALRERIERAGAPSATPHLRVGSGDDAAVVSGEGPMAISVDALVEGVHFRRPPFELGDVGHKALAAALSDIAAMGARAGESLVQLGLPESLDQTDCLELADGLAGVAAAHGVAVAGGDVSRSEVLFCALTVVGHAAKGERLVGRAGARAGDKLAVTGGLGGAAAGLLLLEHPEIGSGIEADTSAALRARQLRPQPRLAAGRALAAAGASAMIDLSDGIAGDSRHVAEASGVELRIDVARLPVQPGVEAVAEAAGVPPTDLVGAGGEDYELLVSLPVARVDEAIDAVAATGIELTVVGEAVAGSGASLIGPAGEVLPASGFDQLRPAPRGRA